MVFLRLLYAYAALAAFILLFIFILYTIIMVALFGWGRLPLIGHLFSERQYAKIMGWTSGQLQTYRQDLRNAALASTGKRPPMPREKKAVYALAALAFLVYFWKPLAYVVIIIAASVGG